MADPASHVLEASMATRLKPTGKPLYERDFHAWSKAQAELLRAGRLADLDLGHLTEEVDDLGESLYPSACSRVRAIIEHRLKPRFSPAAGPRPGWIETLYTQRSDLEGELTPCLRPRVEEALPRRYKQARRNTAHAFKAYGERPAAAALPPTCPYSLDQVAGDWLP